MSGRNNLLAATYEMSHLFNLNLHVRIPFIFVYLNCREKIKNHIQAGHNRPASETGGPIAARDLRWLCSFLQVCSYNCKLEAAVFKFSSHAFRFIKNNNTI